ELGQTETRARLLTAATLAVCRRATISLADDVNRLLRIKFERLGAAMAITITATARVTINSIKVNPRIRRRPLNFQPERDITLPRASVWDSVWRYTQAPPQVPDERAIPRNGWFNHHWPAGPRLRFRSAIDEPPRP